MDEHRRRLQKDARAGDRDSMLRLLAARCLDEGCVRRDERDPVLLSSRHPLAEWMQALSAHRVRHEIQVPKAPNVSLVLRRIYVGDVTAQPAFRHAEFRLRGLRVENWSESSYGLATEQPTTIVVREGETTLTLEFLLRNCQVGLSYHFETDSCFRCGNL